MKLQEASRLTKLSLREFTDLFKDDVKILHRITDPSKVNFLKSLENNWTLVEWIKEFKSIHRLVDVCLYNYFVLIFQV